MAGVAHSVKRLGFELDGPRFEFRYDQENSIFSKNVRTDYGGPRIPLLKKYWGHFPGLKPTTHSF